MFEKKFRALVQRKNLAAQGKFEVLNDTAAGLTVGGGVCGRYCGELLGCGVFDGECGHLLQCGSNGPGCATFLTKGA